MKNNGSESAIKIVGLLPFVFSQKPFLNTTGYIVDNYQKT